MKEVSKNAKHIQGFDPKYVIMSDIESLSIATAQARTYRHQILTVCIQAYKL